MADIENVSPGMEEKGPVPWRRRGQDGEACAGGEGWSLARRRGRRVKQRTVERSDSHQAAGRRNIKGNRLLVREVKNRPSPGHTRIAFIHLLYVLYHWSVIPFRRAAARRTRDYANSAYQQPNRVTWLILSKSHVFHTFLPLFSIFFCFERLIFLYDGIFCIIYATYRRQYCAAKSHAAAASLE